MAEPKTIHETQLLKAVKEGCYSDAEFILSSSPFQVNEERYFDYYLILKALELDELEIALLLVEQGFRVYKETKFTQEKTVLHAAVLIDYNEDLIKILLEKGAGLDILSILSLDEHKKTPFHYAIDKGELSNILKLLDFIDDKTFEEQNFLHYGIEKGDDRVVSYLMTKHSCLKRKNDKNLTPFCIALKNERYRILDILFLYYDIKKINPNNCDDLAPVFIASIVGNMIAIKEYVDRGLPINIPLKLNNQTWSCLINYPGFTLLHFAIKHAKFEVSEFLLSRGSDIFAQDKNGSSPLHNAFENKAKGIWKTWQGFDNNNSIIDQILIANTKLKSNPIDKNRLSHFHIACSRDDATVVENFIKFGASINQAVKPQYTFHRGFSPLHFAAKFRCKKTVEILLKNGANVNKRDSNKKTALHIAVKESCSEVVSLLLQFGADIASIDSDGQTPVHGAFEYKNYKILDLLLSGPNAALSNPVSSEGLSHFHIACTRNNVNVVKSFINSGVGLNTCAIVPPEKDYDPNVIYWDGFSPLHFAVSHNRSKIVQLLLQKGANVGIKNIEGLTPLHLAYKCTHETFGEFIKTTLCNLNKRGKIDFQFQPLTDIIKVNQIYRHGFSGSVEKISWTSNRTEHMKIINALLDIGSDVNSLDNEGNTPVFYAYSAPIEIQRIFKNNLDCSQDLRIQIRKSLYQELHVRRNIILNNLLKFDVNLDKSCKNSSILHFISLYNDEECNEIIELFLKKGANVNVECDSLTPLHRAISSRNKTLVSLLLNYGANVNFTDPRDNSTPLLHATYELGSSVANEIVVMLINKGANVNARQSDGKTALHYVALCQDWYLDQVVSSLIKAGANINSQDLNGFTPLHLACKKKNYETVKAFLIYGADINIEDNKGRSTWCYVYKKYIKNLPSFRYTSYNVSMIKNVLLKHINKMNLIELPVSEKILSTSSNYGIFTYEQEKFQTEVELLQGTKVHDKCTLYDVIFMGENSLSRLVKNPQFQNILQSKIFKEDFREYGYLIELKYQAGVDRAKLLPMAMNLLSDLARLHLPHTCSEHICKHFDNVELRESIETLQGIVNLKRQNLEDTRPLRSCRTNKRLKAD